MEEEIERVKREFEERQRKKKEKEKEKEKEKGKGKKDDSKMDDEEEKRSEEKVRLMPCVFSGISKTDGCIESTRHTSSRCAG